MKKLYMDYKPEDIVELMESDILKKGGVSVKGLSELTGISQRTLYNYIAGGKISYRSSVVFSLLKRNKELRQL